jgi:HEAT repeat protein
MIRKRPIYLMFALLVTIFIVGCIDENNPKYWAKKVKEPAYRETAIKRMGEIYIEALQKAKYNKNDPEAARIKEIIIPVLLDTFNKYKTDNVNRSNILTILAQIGDKRAIPAFEELLDYTEGINETDASKGAEALGGLKSEQSIPKIVGMVRKAIVARKSRGEGQRNRPEEDWIARAAIESLGAIVEARPDTPYRAEAVEILIEIMSTTADEQDFFLNMKSATVLGDIGDPSAIGILIRGLFMQGRGATIYQQCRVALLKISIENRTKVIEWLLKAYKGEFKELEVDAEKYQFMKGVKEEKLGRMFYELRIDPQANKEIFDIMMKKLEDPDPAVSGFTAIALGQLRYKPALSKMVEMLGKSDIQLGLVPGIVEAFEYYQAPDQTSEALLDMITNKEKWEENYRLRASLAFTRIAKGNMLTPYQKAVSQEENEEIRKQMVEFTERLEAAKECGEDVNCWLEKMKSGSWRIQEKALFTLIRLSDSIPAERINDITYLLRSPNQDVLKVLMMLIDEIHPKGCQPSRTCERFKKIIPYWRNKPQMKVRANDAECILAKLIWRQGGKLADMEILDAQGLASAGSE